MAYSNELIDWYNCFFNDEQGIQGYQLISGALKFSSGENEFGDEVITEVNFISAWAGNISKKYTRYIPESLWFLYPAISKQPVLLIALPARTVSGP